MSNVAKLVPANHIANTSSAILQEAIDAKFQTVIVFGFVDGRVHIKTSGVQSNLEIIGALEAAKMQLWGNA